MSALPIYLHLETLSPDQLACQGRCSHHHSRSMLAFQVLRMAEVIRAPLQISKTHRMHNFWCTVYSCQCFKHLESLHGCEEHGCDPVAAQCHVAAGAVGTQSGGTQGTRLGSQPSAHSAGPNTFGYVVGSTRACRKMPSPGKRWNSTTFPTQTLLAAQKCFQPVFR